MSKTQKSLYAHLMSKFSAEDAPKEGEEKVAKRAQRAEESDEDYEKRCEEEDKEEDEKKEAKAESEESDEKEEKDNSKKAARVSERARCAAIFQSSHASGRTALAAQLAFETDLSASAAIGVLASASKESESKSGSLAARMSSVPAPVIGSSSTSPANMTQAQSLLSAAAKVTGDKGYINY